MGGRRRNLQICQWRHLFWVVERWAKHSRHMVPEEQSQVYWQLPSSETVWRWCLADCGGHYCRGCICTAGTTSRCCPHGRARQVASYHDADLLEDGYACGGRSLMFGVLLIVASHLHASFRLLPSLLRQPLLLRLPPFHNT